MISTLRGESLSRPPNETDAQCILTLRKSVKKAIQHFKIKVQASLSPTDDIARNSLKNSSDQLTKALKQLWDNVKYDTAKSLAGPESEDAIVSVMVATCSVISLTSCG